MASFGGFGGAGGGGSGGGGGYGGGTSGQYGPLAGQTFYADPNAAGGLIQKLIANLGAQQTNLNSFIADPTASPLFQGQLSGLLGALAPDEQRGATNLQDMFRNAGNTSSSTFGSAANQYQGDVQRSHQELASKLLGQSFQQIVGALLPQIQQGPQLLEAMRLSQQYRAPQQPKESSGLESLLASLMGRSSSSGGGGGTFPTSGSGVPMPTSSAPGSASVNGGTGDGYIPPWMQGGSTEMAYAPKSGGYYNPMGSQSQAEYGGDPGFEQPVYPTFPTPDPVEQFDYMGNN